MSQYSLTVRPIIPISKIWNQSIPFLGLSLCIGFIAKYKDGGIHSLSGIPSYIVPLVCVMGLLIAGQYSDQVRINSARRRLLFLIIGSAIILVSWLALSQPSLINVSVSLIYLGLHLTGPYKAIGEELHANQRLPAISIQAFLISVGFSIVIMLPEIQGFISSNIPPAYANQAPDYLVLFLFLLTLFWGTFASGSKKATDIFAAPIEDFVTGNENYFMTKYIYQGFSFLSAGLIVLIIVFLFQFDPVWYLITGLSGLLGIAHLVCSLLISYRKTDNILVRIIHNINEASVPFILLTVHHLFVWLGLFLFLINLGGALNEKPLYGDTPNVLFLANFTDFLLMILFPASAITSLVLSLFIRRGNRKVIYWIATVIGGICCVTFYYIQNEFLWIPTIGIGMMLSTMLTMPYTWITDLVPAQKSGFYICLFQSSIILSWYFSRALGEPLFDNFFNGEPIVLILFSGILIAFSSLFILLIRDKNTSIHSFQNLN